MAPPVFQAYRTNVKILKLAKVRLRTSQPVIKKEFHQ